MKSLNRFITEQENNITPCVTKIYKVNLKCEAGSYKIGDIKELRYDERFSYHKYEPNTISFNCQCSDGRWLISILDVPKSKVNSKAAFSDFLDKINAEDDIFKYVIDKDEAEKISNKAIQEFKSRNWTLESVLDAIKKYKPLMDLGYNYRITDTFQQINSNNKQRSIYISPEWRIFVDNNTILLQNAGWHTYEVYNVDSIYQILDAKNILSVKRPHSRIDSSDVESHRQMFGTIR